MISKRAIRVPAYLDAQCLQGKLLLCHTQTGEDPRHASAILGEHRRLHVHFLNAWTADPLEPPVLQAMLCCLSRTSARFTPHKAYLLCNRSPTARCGWCVEGSKWKACAVL